MNTLLRKILITVMLAVIYRLGTFIPVPFVGDHFAQAFRSSSSGIFSLLSGGAHARASLFALGVTPYITASILLQLLGNVTPSLKEMVQNKRRYSKYLKNVALLLAFFHASVFVAHAGLYDASHPFRALVIVVTVAAGSSLAVWLADRVNAHGIGNGVSVMIASGILSEFLYSYGFLLNAARLGERSIWQLALTVLMIVGVVMLVVFVEGSVRKIRVYYTRNVGHQSVRDYSFLPIKLNVVGVLPVIFAGTVMIFADYVLHLPWLAPLREVMDPMWIYMLLNIPLIVLFSIFYAGIVFNADETAAMLKRNHGYIAGYRPGEQTARYLERIVLRLSYVAALYLLLITLLPEFVFRSLNLSVFISGTSLMICVTVIVDVMSRVAAHRLSGRYGTLANSPR